MKLRSRITEIDGKFFVRYFKPGSLTADLVETSLNKDHAKRVKALGSDSIFQFTGDLVANKFMVKSLSYINKR